MIILRHVPEDAPRLTRDELEGLRREGILPPPRPSKRPRGESYQRLHLSEAGDVDRGRPSKTARVCLLPTPAPKEMKIADAVASGRYESLKIICNLANRVDDESKDNLHKRLMLETGAVRDSPDGATPTAKTSLSKKSGKAPCKKVKKVVEQLEKRIKHKAKAHAEEPMPKKAEASHKSEHDGIKVLKDKSKKTSDKKNKKQALLEERRRGYRQEELLRVKLIKKLLRNRELLKKPSSEATKATAAATVSLLEESKKTKSKKKRLACKERDMGSSSSPSPPPESGSKQRAMGKDHPKSQSAVGDSPAKRVIMKVRSSESASRASARRGSSGRVIEVKSEQKIELPVFAARI